jgi:ribosomal protein L40E
LAGPILQFPSPVPTHAMARKICHACGKAVPASARRCPHCGARPKESTKTALHATIGVMGCLVPFVLFVLLVAMCGAA